MKVHQIGLRQMHQRPRAGARLSVLMRDGRQLSCMATMVIAGDTAGIIIYHGRKAIDESQAKGWWPMTPNAELRREP